MKPPPDARQRRATVARQDRATASRALSREEKRRERTSLSLGYVDVHPAPATANAPALTGEPPR